MSGSPFLPPSPRHSRRAARLRRRRRIRASVVLVPLLLAAAAVVVLIRPWSTRDAAAASHARSDRTTVGAARRATRRPSARLSAMGLTLERAPMPLDLTRPAADPLHMRFPEPPRAGLLIDLNTGRVLWQLHPLAHLRIASLTKMMTALLTVKSSPPDARVLITKQAEETSGSKVGVLPLGHRVPLEALLYGLLLPSGNDAAVALAQHVAGTVHRFVGEMNAEAARLGLGCSRYSSPSGYYNSGNYSCAADLAELAHIDLQQPASHRSRGPTPRSCPSRSPGASSTSTTTTRS
jgi:serine-type D-Ala-D-Ala carboxypeptidase (penicillin-binding protein 5/6)